MDQHKVLLHHSVAQLLSLWKLQNQNRKQWEVNFFPPPIIPIYLICSSFLTPTYGIDQTDLQTSAFVTNEQAHVFIKYTLWFQPEESNYSNWSFISSSLEENNLLAEDFLEQAPSLQSMASRYSWTQLIKYFFFVIKQYHTKTCSWHHVGLQMRLQQHFS